MSKQYRFRSPKSIDPKIRASMCVAANKDAARMAADMGDNGIALAAASWDVPADVLRQALVDAGMLASK